jgi:hypothetical protein
MRNRFLFLPAPSSLVVICLLVCSAAWATSPRAVDDFAELAEDGSITVPVLANDYDYDGDPVTIAAVTHLPAHGDAEIVDDSILYTPDPDYNGSDSLRYTITDGRQHYDTATVHITVTPVDDPPRPQPDAVATAADVTVSLNLLTNDLDPDSNGLEADALVTSPRTGTASLQRDGTLTYRFAFTPGIGFSYGVADTFRYRVLDGAGVFAEAQVSVRVDPPADPSFDADGDGMPDLWELDWAFDPLVAAPFARDTDGDGLYDVHEFRSGTNPRDPSYDDYYGDADGDGIANGTEQELGLDPGSSDSDDDGVPDLTEVDAGYNAADSLSRPGVAALAATSPGGEADGLAVDPSPFTDVERFTLAAWLRTDDPDGVVAGRWVAVENGTPPLKAYALEVVGGFAVATMRRAGTTTSVVHRLDSAVRVDDGAWHHIAMTLDPGPQELRLFVDGLEVAARSGLGPLTRGEGSFHILNSPVAGTSLQGLVDEVRVYDHVLSSSELTELGAPVPTTGRTVAPPLTGDEPGLLVGFRFDDAGLTAEDFAARLDGARAAALTGDAGTVSADAPLGLDPSDLDGDGLPAWLETELGTDPGLYDTSGDGVSDWDEDHDGDSLTNGAEFEAGTDPRSTDSDGDGIPDNLEPFWNTDTDGDGLVNAADTDSDGDGLTDDLEDADRDGLIAGDANGNRVPDPGEVWTETDPLVTDSDRDGLSDALEDSDRDGLIAGDTNANRLPDPGEVWTETDPLNADSDADGLGDGEEETAGTDPLDPDSDSDGISDGHEPLWDQDSDGDGLINARDPDADNDGIADGDEDRDRDGLVAGDANGNRILDPGEVWTETDPLSADSDDDGLPDGLEDADRDGRIDGDLNGNRLLDSGEVWTETDPANPDTDGDLLSDGVEDGNADGQVDPAETDPLDPDTDRDGVIDGLDADPLDPQSDTDSDEMPDAWEQTSGLDPLDPDDAGLDADLDGLTNAEEWSLQTDPLAADTDGDRLQDGDEVRRFGTDPANPDTDDDTAPDGDEIIAGYDPLDSLSRPGRRNLVLENTGDDGLAYAVTPVRNDLNLSDFTLAAWVAGGDDSGTIAAQVQSGARDTTAGFALAVRDGRAVAEFTGITRHELQGAAIDDGAWHHVAATLDTGSGAFRLYVDGALVDSLVTGDTPVTGEGVLMLLGTGTPETVLNAQLDEVRIYNRALDRNEMAVLGGQGTAGPVDGTEPGLVAGLRFDDAGTYLEDMARRLDWSAAATTDSDAVAVREPTTPVPLVPEDGDGDGLEDWFEVLAGTDPALIDSDGDGVADGEEDPDDDGLSNLQEQALGTQPLDSDTDDDGVADDLDSDPLDPDSDTDGDSMPDHWETANGLDPLRPDDAGQDPDGDSLDNATEYAVGTDPQRADSDDDTLGDAYELANGLDPLEPDTDGDGILDGDSDADGDGLTAFLEQQAGTRADLADTDGDGIRDGDEPFWDQDSDGDGLINALDPDSDGDGIADGAEDRDRNGLIAGDTNGDRILDPGEVWTESDPLDPDSDGDGLGDGVEDADGDGRIGGDTNGDRTLDPGEVWAETDPCAADTDGDGLADGLEDANRNAVVDSGETDPRLADSDGDGLDDGVEDVDRDGAIAGDTNRDRIRQDDEHWTETDPLSVDTDSDGVPDSSEPDPYGDADADGTINAADRDSDGDGLPDGAEDRDGDGLIAGDTNGDRILDPGEVWTETDPLTADTDGDGVPDGSDAVPLDPARGSYWSLRLGLIGAQFTELEFGIQPGAGDGYDPGIDTRAAPAVPGTSRAVLALESGEELVTDLRQVVNSARWLVRVASEPAAGVTVTWDSTAPVAAALLLCEVDRNGDPVDGGSSFVMDQRASLTVAPDTEAWFSIRFGAETALVTLHDGWNLVSVPLVPTSPETGAVFQAAQTGTVWTTGADGAYIAAGTIEPGRGYWVFRTGGSIALTVPGTRVQEPIAEVTPGWNMVGPMPTDGVSPVALPLTSAPPDGEVYPLWLYDALGAVYQRVEPAGPLTTLDPGIGYWLNAAAPCSIWLGN